MVDSNVNVNHVTKQKKKKNLTNDKIYGSLNKIVEMHPLKNFEIDGVKLGDVINSLDKANKENGERLNKAKDVIKGLNNKIKIIERKLKNYGLN